MKELPPFDHFALPVLSLLSQRAAGASPIDIRGELARQLQIPAELLAQRLPSRAQSTFNNRVGWACTWMKACGWLENPVRNNWRISDSGRGRLRLASSITAAEMRRIMKEEAAADADSDSDFVPDSVGAAEVGDVLTPDERIVLALQQIRQDVEQAVLERLQASSPLFFERAVLTLLDKMGYAGQLGASEPTGGTADGGVDGILYLDRLHLERVYVQAKKWRDQVGAPAVRDFAGAMDAEAATKGVILSTSSFTSEARKYIERSPKAIRLVGGAELSKLMTEFGVGVSRSDVVVIPKLDEDFFDDE